MTQPFHHYGAVLVLCGRSGAGKTTLADRLIATGRFGKVVTTTTRAARPGEENGVHYHFTDESGFRAELESGRMLEHAHVCGRWYGTSASALKQVLASGRHAVLVMDPQGAIAMSNWAHENNCRFAAAFVDADDAVLAGQIALRLHDHVADGGDAEQGMAVQAERLASLMSVEQSWSGAMRYQLTLFNRHQASALDHLTRLLIIASDAAGVPEKRLHIPASIAAKASNDVELLADIADYLRASQTATREQLPGLARRHLSSWFTCLEENTPC